MITTLAMLLSGRFISVGFVDVEVWLLKLGIACLPILYNPVPILYNSNDCNVGIACLSFCYNHNISMALHVKF